MRGGNEVRFLPPLLRLSGDRDGGRDCFGNGGPAHGTASRLSI